MKGKDINKTLMLILFLIIACNSEVENKIDFCKRFKADQSNLTRKEMSNSEKKSKVEARKKAFKENWVLLKSLMEKDKLLNVQKDSCINEFTSATLIHIVQNYPALIFNKETIDELKVEEAKGSIKLNHLITALNFYKDYTPDKMRCKKMKKIVDYAINQWKINGDIEDIVYIDCD